MEPLRFAKGTLESKIQKALTEHMFMREWYCKVLTSNKHQKGLPDLFCTCQSFGSRWIEVKRSDKFSFTQNQLDVFTRLSSKNIGVYVLNGPHDYDKLFGQANWHSFLFNSRGITLSDKLPTPRPKQGPEGVIQNEIIKELTKRDWYVVETHASEFQSGVPDLYACHKNYGGKWIEVKNPKLYSFTPAQVKTFPLLSANGTPIFILTDVSEVDKILGPENWFWFLK